MGYYDKKVAVEDTFTFVGFLILVVTWCVLILAAVIVAPLVMLYNRLGFLGMLASALSICLIVIVVGIL